MNRHHFFNTFITFKCAHIAQNRFSFVFVDRWSYKSNTPTFLSYQSSSTIVIIILINCLNDSMYFSDESLFVEELSNNSIVITHYRPPSLGPLAIKGKTKQQWNTVTQVPTIDVVRNNTNNNNHLKLNVNQFPE